MLTKTQIEAARKLKKMEGKMINRLDNEQGHMIHIYYFSTAGVDAIEDRLRDRLQGVSKVKEGGTVRVDLYKYSTPRDMIYVIAPEKLLKLGFDFYISTKRLDQENVIVFEDYDDRTVEEFMREILQNTFPESAYFARIHKDVSGLLGSAKTAKWKDRIEKAKEAKKADKEEKILKEIGAGSRTLNGGLS